MENWPGLIAVMGLLLLLLGLLMPVMANPAGAITENQAEEYYEAHAALERAASQSDSPNRDKNSSKNPDKTQELEVARQRFESAKADVDTAKTSSANLAFWLKMAGGLFVAAGAGGLMMKKS